jgi:hypothetical protein
MNDKPTRRNVLQRGSALGVLAVIGTGACKSEPKALSCADTTGLLPTDVQIRTTLAYVEASVEPGKACNQCQQFVAPAAAGSCGTCKVLKGPVNPTGYCKSFVAKPT